jgi:hypothetical protein
MGLDFGAGLVLGKVPEDVAIGSAEETRVGARPGLWTVAIVGPLLGLGALLVAD